MKLCFISHIIVLNVRFQNIAMNIQQLHDHGGGASISTVNFLAHRPFAVGCFAGFYYPSVCVYQNPSLKKGYRPYMKYRAATTIVITFKTLSSG